jgi:hypothetical protein
MEPKSLVHLVYRQVDPWSEPQLSRLDFPTKVWSTPSAPTAPVSTRPASNAPVSTPPTSSLKQRAAATSTPAPLTPEPIIAASITAVPVTAATAETPLDRHEPSVAPADAYPVADATDGEIPAGDSQPPADDILAQLAWEGEQALRDASFRSAEQRRFSCAAPAPGATLAAGELAQSGVEAGETVADLIDGLDTIDQLLAGLDAVGADDFLQPAGEPEVLQLFAPDKPAS